MKRGLPKERTFEGPASLLKRVVAFIIDILILRFVVVYPFSKAWIAVPAGSFVETMEFFQQNPGISNTVYTTSAVIGILMMLYFAIFEYKLHQTVGKMLMKIYVKDKKLAFWQCLVRNLFLIPVFPFVLLWITEPLFMIFTKEHQRLLEIITKTKVVEKYPL